MIRLDLNFHNREEDKKSKLKAAESFLKLGEISLETGQNFCWRLS